MSAPTGRRQRQRWWWWAVMGVVVLVALVVGGPTTPDSGVSDDRLFALASQLKCQQCVGESVAGSQSPSAVQFREEIDEQMARGRTDDEILNFFVDRYGQDVLLVPPGSGVGALIWVVPVVAVALGVSALVTVLRRRRPESHDELSDTERDRVDEALRSRGSSRG